jgi:hypothetical protein
MGRTRCGRLGVVAPGVVALCASIKLGGRLVSRPCLEHPPKCGPILALWAVNTGGWKSLHSVPFHDLERDILSGLDVQLFPGIFLDLFSLKAAFWTGHLLLFPRNRPQACLALWTKTQMTRTSLLFDGRFNYAEELFGVFLCRGGCILHDFHWVFSLCRHSQLVVLCERVLLDNAGKVNALFF